MIQTYMLRRSPFMCVACDAYFPPTHPFSIGIHVAIFHRLDGREATREYNDQIRVDFKSKGQLLRLPRSYTSLDGVHSTHRHSIDQHLPHARECNLSCLATGPIIPSASVPVTPRSRHCATNQATISFYCRWGRGRHNTRVLGARTIRVD